MESSRFYKSFNLDKVQERFEPCRWCQNQVRFLVGGPRCINRLTPKQQQEESVMILKELLELAEKKWSAQVETSWKPKEGFFTQSAEKIASGLKANSRDLKQAMSRLNFFINRAGSKLSADDFDRLERAKKALHNLYK
jgi:hypothetical protein